MKSLYLQIALPAIGLGTIALSLAPGHVLPLSNALLGAACAVATMLVIHSTMSKIARETVDGCSIKVEGDNEIALRALVRSEIAQVMRETSQPAQTQASDIAPGPAEKTPRAIQWDAWP